jgi:hypothetical protein
LRFDDCRIALPIANQYGNRQSIWQSPINMAITNQKSGNVIDSVCV